MPCVGFHSHGTHHPALAVTLGLGSLPINTHFPTDLISFTSAGSLPPHVTGRKIIPPSSDRHTASSCLPHTPLLEAGSVCASVSQGLLPLLP